jgi:hypothetical protein
MSTPFPGLKVYIDSDGQTLEYLNKSGIIKTVKNQSVPVTNYEYEIRLNEQKRQILLIKPEYVGVLVSDIKNMMTYSESSQYVNPKTKRVYNPRKVKT